MAGGSIVALAPMLVADQPLDAAELERLICDPGFACEPKMDGRRALMRLSTGGVTVFNRNGETASIPLPRSVRAVLEASAPTVTSEIWLDGEIVDDRFEVFDLPSAGGVLSTRDGWMVRREVLVNLIDMWSPPESALRVVPAVRAQHSKRAMIESIRDAGGEGVVLKKVDAPYMSGHRSRFWRKAKFWKDVDCVVSELRRGGKDNMVLCVYDNTGRPVEVGECTRLAGDGQRVKIGSVVTVQYLRFSEGGRLVHPTLPRLRDDKPAGECSIAQLL